MTEAERPTLRILFWNVNGQPRSELIAALCEENQVDVLVVAEWDYPPNEIVLALANRGIAMRWTGESDSRLHCFSVPLLKTREIYTNISGKLAIYQFQWQSIKFLLAATHLLSGMSTETDDRDVEATKVADEVRQKENERSNHRTIAIGDFNLNPFNRGLAQAIGFHGVMTKDQAIDESRTVQFSEYPMFYNPMWGLFGDQTPGPPGTFYYRNSAQLSYDWNMFDQVLLRPAVMELADEEVTIVQRCAEWNLLSKSGRPDRNIGSDHLPLLVALRWKGEPTCPQ